MFAQTLRPGKRFAGGLYRQGCLQSSSLLFKTVHRQYCLMSHKAFWYNNGVMGNSIQIAMAVHPFDQLMVRHANVLDENHPAGSNTNILDRR
jgi:hypothetical protein